MGTRKFDLRRYRWLIPVLFMALAALACDGPNYEPPRVSKIQADPSLPGKAYALVQGNRNPNAYGRSDDRIDQAYETRDYGQTWVPVTIDDRAARFPETSEADLSLFGVYEGNLYKNTKSGNAPIWYFPRQTFRSFFAPDNAGSSYESPYFIFGSVPSFSVSPADPGVIWVAMGTEGVLVGPNPLVDSPAVRSWTLTRNGLTGIHYLPLSITRPDVIAMIVALGLLVPPLSLIHVVLLARAYLYAFQPGEERDAYRLAGLVTGSITILAAFAIVFWLTNESIDYYPVVAVMTGICVLFGVGGGIWISRKRDFSALFIRRMAWACALLSLIVPAGVASVWFLWPFIIGGSIAFGITRLALTRYLDQEGVVATRWGLDRFALELVIGCALLLIPLGGTLLFGAGFFRAFEEIPLLLILAAIVIWIMHKLNSRSLNRLWTILVGLNNAIMTRTFSRRAERFTAKKKSPSGDAESALQTPLFSGQRWLQTLAGAVLSWILAGGVAAVGFFLLQLWVSQWFRTLLIETGSRVAGR